MRNTIPWSSTRVQARVAQAQASAQSSHYPAQGLSHQQRHKQGNSDAARAKTRTDGPRGKRAHKQKQLRTTQRTDQRRPRRRAKRPRGSCRAHQDRAVRRRQNEATADTQKASQRERALLAASCRVLHESATPSKPNNQLRRHIDQRDAGAKRQLREDAAAPATMHSRSTCSPR